MHCKEVQRADDIWAGVAQPTHVETGLEPPLFDRCLTSLCMGCLAPSWLWVARVQICHPYNTAFHIIMFIHANILYVWSVCIDCQIHTEAREKKHPPQKNNRNICTIFRVHLCVSYNCCRTALLYSHDYFLLCVCYLHWRLWESWYLVVRLYTANKYCWVKCFIRKQ